MAFATLEDLEDKIDLVFFPRTWKEYRDQVEIDQVLLVNGKLQFKGAGERSIIVDRVSTKIQVAASADPEPTVDTRRVVSAQRPSTPPPSEPEFRAPPRRNHHPRPPDRPRRRPISRRTAKHGPYPHPRSKNPRRQMGIVSKTGTVAAAKVTAVTIITRPTNRPCRPLQKIKPPPRRPPRVNG